MLGFKGSLGKKMVLLDRIELSTSPLPMECSTTELQQRNAGAVAVPARRHYCHSGTGRARMSAGAWQGVSPPGETSGEAMVERRKAELRAEREARLADALRRNLRRRKEAGEAAKPRVSETMEQRSNSVAKVNHDRETSDVPD